MQTIKDDVQRWLEEVVIGLNLCPFAAKPNRQKVIRIEVCNATSHSDLSAVLLHELALLSNTPAAILETTLLVLPEMLQDFYEYNDYLDVAERVLRKAGYEGELQIASFHPDYCFAGTEPDDAENLTNRSPYPILHLIREESLEDVLARYPDPESIPENNIRRVEALSPEEKRRLFPYLFR
ncbi:MAG: DUF1415 domain-containing protein [Oceanospirillaceae bacterium]|nr:DUF1415 domain-containing protein [Oceanospirillaceae bacterium]MCP5335646.1 DUF1415 domain-containing protein [Oceanospirillaceae bacterium]